MSLEGKSDAEIIRESERSLNEQSKLEGRSENSTAAEESNVTAGKENLSQFPTTDGIPQVSVGRTGQTGGGTSAQILPESEGADRKDGESSAMYENAQGKDDLRAKIAGANPGSVNLGNNQSEPIGSTDGPHQELIDQNANPFDPNAKVVSEGTKEKN